MSRMGDFWESEIGIGTMFFGSVILFLTVLASIVVIAFLPSVIMDYKIKCRMIPVIEKAVDKGLELRLNGDLLKGIELIKVVDTDTTK